MNYSVETSIDFSQSQKTLNADFDLPIIQWVSLKS